MMIKENNKSRIKKDGRGRERANNKKRKRKKARVPDGSTIPVTRDQ